MTLSSEQATQAAQHAQIGNKDPARFPLWPAIKHLLSLSTLTDNDEMFAKVHCWPPLGEPTVIPFGQNKVLCTVVLETDGKSEKNWEVELWQGLAGEEWRSTAMQYVCEDRINGEEETVLSVGAYLTKAKKHVFNLEIQRPPSGQSHTQFTVKFRSTSVRIWKWVKDQLSVSDGSIYWQQGSKPSNDFHYYIHGTSQAVKVTDARPQTPDSLLWELSCPVGGADGRDSCFEVHTLGLAVNFTRWFATCRLMTTWLRPKHGQNKFSIDNDKAVSVAFLRHDGLSVVALALSGIDDASALFKEDEFGNVVIEARNDGEKAGHASILVSVADSFDIANAAVMYHARARSLSAQGHLESQPVKSLETMSNSVNTEWIEEWYDGFGYCTWNSLGQKLDERSIINALEQFKSDGIILTSLIIDDNWQSLDHEGQDQGHRGMTRFEADAVAFPEGLKSLISKIKKLSPSMSRVAVWHTMLGYWGAISPHGELARQYKTVQATNTGGYQWTCIAGDDVERYYNDFFRFLADCGVDGIKTDSINSLDDLKDATNRRTMINQYQDAWTIAGLRHLGARLISCGSQQPIIMFHSMIKTNTPRLIVRNSDDFFPDNPGSHPWHIFCNAHNSLMMQHLNVIPDWDMFQTDHDWAWYHAAARCLSGGPIYITDYPNKHDKALIAQMTARTTSGTTVVLRTSRLGKASGVYTAYSEPKLLKIDTYNGPARTGTSMVGVFNVSQEPLTELISLSDFPGTEEGEYIIRSHALGRTTNVMRRETNPSVVLVELYVKGYEIFTAYPVRDLIAAERSIRVANLGLVDKMSGAAAIVSEQIYSVDCVLTDTVKAQNRRARVWTALKALGTWGIWIENLPSFSLAEDFFALVSGKPIDLRCVSHSATDRNVLEIDLVKAWELSENKATRGNEVAVELFIG